MKPDPLSHKCGWEAKIIDGLWRVGMKGNLDTVHDAVITVHRHTSDGQEAEDIASWIVEKYNMGNDYG